MKKLFKNMKENEKGFTLIELIVVIAIIGILAAVLLPKFSGFTDKARQKAVLSEAKSIYTAYAAVQADEGIPADDTAATKAIRKYLGKLPMATATVPASGSTAAVAGTEVTLTIKAPVLAEPDLIIIEYKPVVNGKNYTVKIKDGGNIDITTP